MLKILVVLHVLSAIWFTGGMAAFVLLHVRLLQTNLLVDRIYYLRIALQFTKIAIVPGGLSAVIFGIVLAIGQGYNILHTAWLSLSLLLFIYATLVGVTYLTPNDRRVLHICQEEQTKNLSGAVSYHLLHRPHILALRLVNVIAVFALLLLMIIKPLILFP